MGDRKPSEIIQDFIDLLNYANDIYTKSKSECEQLDSIERVRSWQHKFEFAKDKQERNRLATALHKERLKRRKYKDTVDLYRYVHDFSNSENNKAVLKRLGGMLNLQKRTEEYLESDREYKAGDGDDSNRG
ncbi:hypothetical protein MCI89_14120 [Muricomes sp. OA1]|uniref:hypothetical protein n=1 Tax=Lachnospiraceae TaxID=186803 RepID=UPI001F052136|nr:hypothetical protein [Muricomes sp. OA1]MCH1973480.1 hypothetical protein [Muricomes sp. OA1]MDU7706075.1 hypothetical protein [Clostridium sp.]